MPREVGIVYALANEVAKREASPFIPDRDWDPEGVILEMVQPHLKYTDYICHSHIFRVSTSVVKYREVEEGLKTKKSFLLLLIKELKSYPKTLPNFDK